VAGGPAVRHPAVYRSRVPPDSNLGRQFRALRKSRGLSLSDVADATEISSSFLSLFETGKSDITFGRLARLVKFFGVSITDLIPGPEPDQSVVVRRTGRRHLESQSEHAAVELLTHHARHKMLPVLVSLDAGGIAEETIVTEGGELFLYVLRGKIEIDDGRDNRLRVGKGDAVYLRTDRQRTFRNAGNTTAEWLAVRTPSVL
jgi:transcriptional regulator with XRE-family HTH domain